jgi:hypothetical protein
MSWGFSLRKTTKYLRVRGVRQRSERCSFRIKNVYGFITLCLCVRQKATGTGKSDMLICKQSAY